jgi:hypothetical protein
MESKSATYKRARKDTLLILYNLLKEKPPELCKNVLLNFPKIIRQMETLDRKAKPKKWNHKFRQGQRP